MNSTFKILSHILVALIMPMAMMSCSQESTDEPDDGGYGDFVDFTIRLAVKDHTTPGVSRAMGGDFVPETELDNELMHTWKLVFVDNSSTVRLVVDGGSADKPIRFDEVRGRLRRGTYNVYAFSDIKDKVWQSTLDLNPHKDMQWNAASATALIYSNVNKDYEVPKTGSREITVTGRVDEVHEIEMIRTHARLELTFANKSASHVRIDNIHFGEIYDKPRLPLFRDPVKQPLPPSIESAETTYYNFPIINDNSYFRRDRMAPGTEYKDGTHANVYLAEGRPNENHAGAYAVRVYMTRSSDANGTANVRKDTLTVLTSKDVIPYINRNDYIQIPIAITDWIVDYDVQFYPPIGGYPAVEQLNKDKECFFIFKSAGKFAIIPKIRNAAPGSAYLLPSQYSITLTPFSVTDGLFEAAPAQDPVTHEIVGELGQTVSAGRASYRIDVNIPAPDGSGTTLSYSRTIIIIRQ